MSCFHSSLVLHTPAQSWFLPDDRLAVADDLDFRVKGHRSLSCPYRSRVGGAF